MKLERFFLFPVADATPAVDDFFARWPEDDGPVSEEQLRDAIAIAFKFVKASEKLLGYAGLVSGAANRN